MSLIYLRKTTRLFFCLLFFTTLNLSVSTAKNFSIQISAGISKVLIIELEQYYNIRSNESYHFEINNQNYNYFPSFCFKYSPINSHQFALGIDYINSYNRVEVIFDRPVQTYMEIPDIDYHIQSIPITLMYEFYFNQNMIVSFIAISFVSIIKMKANHELS